MIENRYRSSINDFLVDVSRVSIAKFLSNCEKNNLHDVIEDELIFLLLFKTLTTIGEGDMVRGKIDGR